MSDWLDAVAAAKKVLGAKGKLPDATDEMKSSGDAKEKAGKAFGTGIADFRKKIQAFRDANEKLKDASETFLDALRNETFGLNKDDPDDKKRIAQAKSILMKAVQSITERLIQDNGQLIALDKILGSF